MAIYNQCHLLAEMLYKVIKIKLISLSMTVLMCICNTENNWKKRSDIHKSLIFYDILMSFENNLMGKNIGEI